MRSWIQVLILMLVSFTAAISTSAQVDEVCGDTGAVPWLNTPFVYGKVVLNGFDTRKLPKITVVLYDRSQNPHRFTIDRNGNYCFRDVNANGGYLVIEVEGSEVVRRSLPTSGPAQHREDFEITPLHPTRTQPPGTVSAKFPYTRNEKNTELFRKASDAEKERSMGKAVKMLKEIVESDPADFIAWAKLCFVLFEQNSYSDAQAACRKAIEAKADYTPAMINLGRIQMVQKEIDAAIATLTKATQVDPTYARAFQLLGEAFLLARKGNLGVEALNEAIRLDPVGMAESHLLMALLYDRAGAKKYASREYRLFLEKVPNHPDKRKFEKYIKDNPE